MGYKRSLMIVGVLTAVAAISALTVWKYRPARLLAYWVAGRCTGCTLRATLQELTPAIEAEASRIRNASRQLAAPHPGIERWMTPAGEFYSPLGNALFWDLAEQAVDVYGSAQESVRPGDIVLDCGANVGTFTRTALSRGASRVVMFDIDPRNVRCLNLTFASEISAGRVTVIEKGVWDEESTMEAKFFTNTNLNTVVMESRPETTEQPISRKVPLTRIDRVVADLGLPRVDFIKIDVEGAESRALAGARATIQKFKPRMSIAVENEPDDIHRVPAAVAASGVRYAHTSGPCRYIRRLTVRPEALFFVPQD